MAGLQPKRTLVPVDFSELSFDALDRALEITAPDGIVDVVHVLPTLSPMEPGMLYGELTEESRLENVTANLKKRLLDPKYDRVSLHAHVGDPGTRIAEVARAQKSELIVIPSHGYGLFKHLLLGSVAERVVRLARCPVLVMRSPETSEEQT